mmetsp:Transcript_27692/g.42615  ORF Transcript_27692/g.42615 Transcript_27692/m.42615 type:complete len:169 (-) Transcript_27692:67-573(-)
MASLFGRLDLSRVEGDSTRVLSMARNTKNRGTMGYSTQIKDMVGCLGSVQPVKPGFTGKKTVHILEASEDINDRIRIKDQQGRTLLRAQDQYLFGQSLDTWLQQTFAIRKLWLDRIKRARTVQLQFLTRFCFNCFMSIVSPISPLAMFKSNMFHPDDQRILLYCLSII